jgi:hypothetical protein
MIDRYCKLDANVDRSTSCMERVCDTHTSICMERDQMSPQPRPRHLMIGRWSSSACMSLIGTYLCSARATSTLSSPILGKAATQHWRHIHMLRLTPTRVHTVCKPPCMQAIGLHTTLECLPWQMSQHCFLRGICPRCKYITTCREKWCSCLPTSRLCLSVRHARATSAFYPYTPRTRLACAGARSVGQGFGGVCQSVRELRARVDFLMCRLRCCGGWTGARVSVAVREREIVTTYMYLPRSYRATVSFLHRFARWRGGEEAWNRLLEQASSPSLSYC